MRTRSSLLPFCAALIACVVAAWPAASSHAETVQTAAAPMEALDIDGNGSVGALTDALLVMRYVFGLRGQPLIQGAVGPDATRSTAAQIEAYLASMISLLSNPGNCSIAAVPASSAAAPVAPGSSVLLTASCAKGAAPIAFAWNIGSLLPSVSVAPAVTTTYTVTPSNSHGPGVDFSTTVHIGVVLAPSNCSITQTPDTVATAVSAGISVNLSMSCNGGSAATSCSWNNGILTTACATPVSPSMTTTYSATASNTGGSSPSVSTTVHVGVAPSNCSIAQAPDTVASAVSAGTTVNLSMSCNGGNAATSCSWNNGIASTACAVNVSPSMTTTYSATASNAAGSSPSTSTTVNVLTPPPGSQNFCVGGDEIIATVWPPSGQLRLFTNGFKDQKLAYKFVVPFTFNPPLNVTHLGFFRIAEVPGFTVTSRQVTVSKHSCDFQSGNYLFYGGSGDTAPYISFTTNNPDGYITAGGAFNINSGDTVYVNVRNQINGTSTCPYDSCDILFDIATPNRY